MNDTTESPQHPPQRVEARPSKDPAVRLFIISGMLIAFAVYCYVDKEDPPPAWDFKHINEASAYALHIGGPIVFGPAGLVSAVWGIVFLRRRLVADDAGIGYLGKNKIAWDDVTEVDAGKLKSKGILYLHHGKNSVLKLDSWKLTDFRDLVALVEQNIPKERMKT